MSQKGKESLPKWTLATLVLAEYQRLQERLAALDRQSRAQDREQRTGDNTPTSDTLDAAQEAVAKEVESASREALVSRIRALARAEEKIREGSYGRCDDCGRPISAARLRAMPEAVRCVSCAER